MTDLKREYVIPLRRKCKTAPMWRRSKKAISVLKDFMRQHMKTENIIICSELNESIWKNGGKNPPGKVAVVAVKKEINGVLSTVVNLQTAGVDTQLGTYKSSAPVVEAPAKKAEVKSEVKEAEVKEVKSEAKAEEVVEEKSEAKTEEPAKEEVKKE